MTDIRNEPSTRIEIKSEPHRATGTFATYLTPYDAFPLDVTGIATLELHVLNSRVSRQREWEYTSISGPHSETEERFHELQAELNARDVAVDGSEW